MLKRIPYNTDLDAPFTSCDLCGVSEYDRVSDSFEGDGPRADFLPMYEVEIDGVLTTVCENCAQTLTQAKEVAK